jgi:hypothetical protein
MCAHTWCFQEAPVVPPSPSLRGACAQHGPREHGCVCQQLFLTHTPCTAVGRSDFVAPADPTLFARTLHCAQGGHYLDDFITEIGGVNACEATEPFTGCSDKEKTFIEAINAKSDTDKKAQLVRLNNMVGSKMTEDNKKWLKQRLAILKQMVPADSAEL